MAKAKAMLGVTPDTRLIVAFGYFDPSKNLLLLLKAFRRLKTRVPNIKLWLGGYIKFPTSKTLSYRDRCLRYIRAYGLENDLIFPKTFLPEENVANLLGAADIACFVYNEDTRSSSGALHLAMGLSKVVIASRIPKFQELAEVSDEVLVNPLSVGELSRLLSRLLLDDQFQIEIKQKVESYARRTAWPSVAQQHWLLYAHLLSAQAASVGYTVPFNQLRITV